jgi:excisionase family DNA binding protein
MLNTEEAASFLGMTVDGLRGLTSKKLIPFYKPNGKNIYFDVDELVAWQKKNHFEPIGTATRKGSDS